MQKFIMLVGLPGSGKSTYAKEVFGGILFVKNFMAMKTFKAAPQKCLHL